MDPSHETLYLRRHVTTCRRWCIENSGSEDGKILPKHVTLIWRTYTLKLYMIEIIINMSSSSNSITETQTGRTFVAYSADNPLIITLFSDALSATVTLASFMIHYLHTVRTGGRENYEIHYQMPSAANPTRSIYSRSAKSAKSSMEPQVHEFLTSALGGWELSVSFSSSFTSRKTHYPNTLSWCTGYQENDTFLFICTARVHIDCGNQFIPTVNSMSFLLECHKHVSTQLLQEQIQVHKAHYY